MTLTPKNSSSQCPLCSEPNSCAVSAGKSIDECWCTQVEFSQAVIEKIPETEKLTRCLCPACAKDNGGYTRAR